MNKHDLRDRRVRAEGQNMFRKLIAVFALAVAVVVVPAPARAASPLQPGSYVRTSLGGCTLNFVFDGAGGNGGKVYLGTAAHCVEKLGDTVRDDANATFGRVAFIGNADRSITDYALIEVSSAHVSRVTAALKGHPQYPTGYTTANETAAGDLIQISGYGMVFGETKPTQEQRVGVLVWDDNDQYGVDGPIIFGDSGGPLVHIPSGKALGVVSRLGSITSDMGPTIDNVLRAAAADGFPVTLRTV